MMYLQLAWRYTTRRLVNFIAIAALALALAVQIVAMAVLDGMLVDLEKRLRNLGEQITLRATGPIPDREAFARAGDAVKARVKGVRAVTPYFQDVGFLEAAGRADYVYVQGIDLEAELANSSLADHLLDYKPDPRRPVWTTTGNRPGLFMGEQLANAMGVRAGMEVELFAAERDADNKIELRSKRFRVVSLFRSGVYEKDRYSIYIPLDEAAAFYLSDAYDDAAMRVPRMVVWLDDPNQADAVAEAVTAAAHSSLMAEGEGDPGLVTDTWQKRWSVVAQGMKHENNLMELVLLLNDAASGFCVFAILVTLVSRRIRDVGLLRCIGATRRGVMSVFLTVGLIIGVSGGVLGVAAGAFLAGPMVGESVAGQWRLSAGGAVDAPLGVGESAAARRPRIDRYYEAVTGDPLYPPRMFGVADEAGLPTVIYPWKLALYWAAAILVSVMAAIYPAAWAAWREPMSALREG